MKRISIKFKIVSVFILSAFCLTLATNAQELNFTVVKSKKDWDEAKENALKSGKDIFLDIYATWCGPCKMMDSDVYTVAEVGNFFNASYINLKVDGESDFGTVLASQYKLTAYPSMYFINSSEELLYEAVGYRAPEALIETGKLVKESGKRYMELNSKYSLSALSESETEEYMVLLGKFENKNILAALAAEKIKAFTESDILNPANKAILIAVAGDIESFPVQTVMKNAATLATSWGQEDLSQYLSSAFDLTMQRAAQNADSALMEKIAIQLVPVYMMGNPDRIPEAQLTTRKIYYSQLEEWENYILAVEKHYNQLPEGNIKFLYSEAYYVIENQLFNPALLTRCNEWLEKVIAVQPDFDSYFLTAIVNTYNEKPDVARSWIAKAESVTKTDDEKNSIEELKKFLDSL